MAKVSDINQKQNIKKLEECKKSRFPLGVTISIVILILGVNVLTTMIAIKAIKQPYYVYYGASCANRSCQNNLGLQCINDQCQCNKDSFYLNKCIIKKTKSEKCHHISSICDDTKHLLCLNGLCDCDDRNYWNISYCYPKQTYQGACQSDIHCLTNALLYCDTIQMKCLCSID